MLKCSAFAGQRDLEDWSVLLSLAQGRFSASEVQEWTSRLLLHLLWPPTTQLCMLSLPCSSPQTGLYLFSASYPPLTKKLLNSLLDPPGLQVLCLSLLCLLWGPLLPQGQPSLCLASGAKQRWWDRRKESSRHCWIWTSLLLSFGAALQWFQTRQVINMPSCWRSKWGFRPWDLTMENHRQESEMGSFW